MLVEIAGTRCNKTRTGNASPRQRKTHVGLQSSIQDALRVTGLLYLRSFRRHCGSGPLSGLCRDSWAVWRRLYHVPAIDLSAGIADQSRCRHVAVPDHLIVAAFTRCYMPPPLYRLISCWAVLPADRRRHRRTVRHPPLGPSSRRNSCASCLALFGADLCGKRRCTWLLQPG